MKLYYVVLITEPGTKGPQFDIKKTSLWSVDTSDKEPLTAREAAFGTKASFEDKPKKVNIYEGSEYSTSQKTEPEQVDTDSIADLNSTRKRWENIFQTNTGSPHTSTPRSDAKKSVKHWEVKLPYKPSPVVQSQTSVDKMEEEVEVSESAIDREIRLANEREEMLKREQAERHALIEKQEAYKQKETPATVEQTNNNNNEQNKPMFLEMTEADRGSELQQREDIIKQELVEQQQREHALQTRVEPPSDQVG